MPRRLRAGPPGPALPWVMAGFDTVLLPGEPWRALILCCVGEDPQLVAGPRTWEERRFSAATSTAGPSGPACPKVNLWV